MVTDEPAAPAPDAPAAAPHPIAAAVAPGYQFEGAALELGKGRVVALAEAAMITAQEDGGRRIGMNAPGNDNRRFLLNILSWLGRAS